jgi:hypothetical protein
VGPCGSGCGCPAGGEEGGGVPLEHHDRNRIGSEAWDGVQLGGGGGGFEEAGGFPSRCRGGAARYQLRIVSVAIGPLDRLRFTYISEIDRAAITY